MFDSDDHRIAARAASITPDHDGVRADWPEAPCAADVARAAWRKSSWSSFNGNCVEVAPLGDALVGVRDTKDEGAGPVLAFDGEAWRSFLNRIRREGPA